jgi:pimeloyl-ACP methyl ester carboxylesterase
MMVHHVVDGPDGAPALILLPSLGSNVSIWDAHVRLLRRHFRVIRCELRGHGRSAVPAGPYTIEELGRDILDVLDHHGLARAHLGGV